jgi:SAM-dependent methyltransferase
MRLPSLTGLARTLRAKLEADKAWINRRKHQAELNFWREEIKKYVDWYHGGAPLYGLPCPSEPQKVKSEYGVPIDAIETWLRCFQMPKYVGDLRLKADSFRGLRVLDVGCGPFPNLCAFNDCFRIGIDPLVHEYQEVGFPLDVWSRDCTYCQCKAEAIPFPARSFDAVISVNAIDHVDDFAETAREVRRVLRLRGVFRMHVHYHGKTVCEPIELNDEVFLSHYSWVSGLRKIHEDDTKDLGGTKAKPGERYVVWGNT